MIYDAYKLPMRSSPGGEQIETRPLYIEEWLDSLPYIDFRKTSQLLFEATKATNAQALKPEVRMELVELYNRPYQYYIDSQIKAGAQHTLQSIDTMQEQILMLKRIAVNLGLACKISADEALKKKTLWGQSKPPLLNLLHSLNYLSHALIFSFLEYAPVPKNVWREINFIYDFAESLGQENTSLQVTRGKTASQTTTIAEAYTRICLAAMADPHHLPYGAIWEIYEQLKLWSGLAKVLPYKTPSVPAGMFVIKLDSDSSPLPYGKFNTASAGEKHRLLDTTALMRQVEMSLARVEKGAAADSTLILSPYFARILLGHMVRSWGTPPKRVNQRQEREGSLELACGIPAAWFLLNGEREFVEPDSEHAEQAGHDSHPNHEKTPVENYRVDQWNLVDQSARGFAVIKNVRPTNNIRVGDLIAISTRSESGKWAVGVIRWLMIRDGQAFKIGVQMLSTRAKPIAVRERGGSGPDHRYRRGLLIPDMNDNEPSIITAKGMFAPNRDLEIVGGSQNRQTRVRALSLLESTAGFEQFLITPTQ